MSKIKHTLIHNEEYTEQQTDYLDDQYRYKEFLREIEYDSRRIDAKQGNDDTTRLWHWPSDN